jgi:crotonobetainyl-CoA:carnitine CoA-transferase CaiB-like acyl-CoA transferase
MRPGVAEKLGLSYEDLKAVNPELIYVSINGFGSSGPLSSEPVYDPLVQSRSGFVNLQSRLHADPAKDTRLINSLIHDKTTAMTAVQAVMAALFAAKVNGAGGQHVEIAMLDVGLQFLWGDAHSQVGDSYFMDSDSDERIRVNPNIIQESFAVHPCKDGHVAFLQMEREVKFERFAKAFAPEFLTDDRFNTARGRMVMNNAEFRAAIDASLASYTMDEIYPKLKELDIPGAPVFHLAESWRQPQVIVPPNIGRDIPM